jgi:hypothetical protein
MFREGGKTNSRWPHSKILEVSNIDQRFAMASRDDAAIIAPFESSR